MQVITYYIEGRCKRSERGATPHDSVLSFFLVTDSGNGQLQARSMISKPLVKIGIGSWGSWG